MIAFNRGALAFAVGGLALYFALPASAQSLAPQCRNANGSYVPCTPAVLVDKTGTIIDANNPLPTGAAPLRATSTPAGGTIAAANAYQSAIAASPTRLGCLIQNTSTGILRVYVGSPGAATDAAALQIAAGNAFSCSSANGLIITDQVSVASDTAASSYVVVIQ